MSLLEEMRLHAASPGTDPEIYTANENLLLRAVKEIERLTAENESFREQQKARDKGCP